MNHRKAKTRFIALFLSPAIFLYAGLVLWPLIQAFQLSTYRWRGVSIRRRFVGLDNFQQLWNDQAFQTALRNLGFLLVFASILLIGLGLLIAHAIQDSGKLSKFTRAIYLLPHIMSLVVVALLWKFLLNPSFGLLDRLARFFGAQLPSGILGDPNWALPAVGTAFVWYALGFYVMLFAAGIRQLSAEVLESASLDGSQGLHRFWNITWPMLWSVRRVALTYVVINVLNVFTIVFLMTEGGPSRRSEVPLTYLYEQAFKNSQFGYSATIAVVCLAVSMVCSLGILFATRKDPEGARA